MCILFDVAYTVATFHPTISFYLYLHGREKNKQVAVSEDILMHNILTSF